MKTADDAPSGDKAMKADEYITNANVYYIDPDTNQPVLIVDDTVIPKKATWFEIGITFTGVPTVELRDDHDRSLYYDLPEPLSNATLTENRVHDDTGRTEIGSIRASGGRVLLTYDEGYLQGDSFARTSGNFTFRCNVDKDKVTGNPVTVVIGQTTVHLNFEQEDIAETGQLGVTKPTPRYVAGSDPVNSGYLEYTLTVATGNDAMPEVRVEDTITSGAGFVDGYLVTGELADGTPCSVDGTQPLAADSAVTLPDGNGTATVTGSSPGKMTWTIGNMSPNETRTLTYRIKLNKNYVGLYNRNALQNSATPYSKGYAHDPATSNFTPSVSATVSKTAGTATESADNTKVTIPYTVTIQADQANTWPIRNLKIADNLGSTYAQGNTATGEADRAAMCEYARFQNFRVEAVDAKAGQPRLKFRPAPTRRTPKTRRCTTNRAIPTTRASTCTRATPTPAIRWWFTTTWSSTRRCSPCATAPGT